MLKETKTVCADSHNVLVFIAGNYDDAVRACREFAMEGACVTVSKTTYVYTGGVEEGVIVGIINYPRFPKSANDLDELAERLGLFLMDRLFQMSFTIASNNRTVWYSRRPE